MNISESSEPVQDGLFPDPNAAKSFAEVSADAESIREAAEKRTNPYADSARDRNEAYHREQGGQTVPAEFSQAQIRETLAAKAATRAERDSRNVRENEARANAELARRQAADEEKLQRSLDAAERIRQGLPPQ